MPRRQPRRSSALAPSETSEQSVTLTAPSTPGTYVYGACIDPVSHESDTTNNCSDAVAVTVLPLPPDLVVDVPTAEEGSPMVGQSFTLNLPVRNHGTGSSVASTLTIYRSTDSTISSDDVEEAAVQVSALATSETSEQSVTLTAPSHSGHLRPTAHAIDPVSHESDTTNNCSEAVAVTVLPLPPDLVVDVPTAEEGSPMVGQSFTLNLPVRNQGTGSADASTLTIYRSTDSTISSDDVEEAAVQVSALATSESSQQSVTLAAPSTPGSYQYGACIDPVSHESDTTNNCSDAVAVTVLPLPPDLVVDVPTPEEDSPMVGQPFTLSLPVRNQGAGPADSSTLTVYRSTDSTISSDDVEEATVQVSALATSESSRQSVTLAAPSIPGTYQYGACVDAVSHESDTTNNCSDAVAVTVIPLPPDLVVDALRAEENSRMAGQIITLNVPVRNQGAGPADSSTLTVYRSTDSTISSDDVEEATVQVSALATSETSEQSVTLTAPSTPGTYVYGACIDPVSHESDTTNNCSEAVAVTVLEFKIERLTWVRDGISGKEEAVVHHLRAIARKRTSIAQRLSGSPWLSDGITESELRFVSDIRIMALSHPEIALQVTTVPDRTGQLLESVLTSLREILEDDPSLSGKLQSQAWFRDGLTKEEAALIVVLRSASADEHVLQDLLEGEYVRSKKVLLPLAGEVDLFAVGRKEHELEGELERMASYIELQERYMVTSWPSPNVIALVETESDLGRDFRGWYTGDHIVLTYLSKATTSHELAHYYFNGDYVPDWLIEGGAEFLRIITLDLVSEGRSVNNFYLGDRVHFPERCDPGGPGNVQGWLDTGREHRFCRYWVGRQFLGGMHRALGQEVVSTALRDLHEEGKASGPVSEQEILEAFLTSTPAAQRDKFRLWYSCLHGRPIPGFSAPSVPGPLHETLYALESLYNATNGPSWENSENWLTNAPLDEWHGVTVDCDGSVIGLDLSANGLTGQIPGELSGIADLLELNLVGNKLAGRIPHELGDLSNLTTLLLEANQLRSPIPLELFGLSRLERLTLARNQFTGTMPAELSKLSRLQWLSLSDNLFSGYVPPALGKLSNLSTLNLSRNKLTGQVPSELGGLSNLGELWLQGNNLTGPIPSGIGLLHNLEALYLARNQLTGPIPPELINLSRLKELRINENQLTGLIPAELGMLTDLEALYLSQNNLSGPIPPELSDLVKLDSLGLSENQLTGPIPPELGSFANLRLLFLGDNRLTGRIPSELGELGDTLEYLTISGNQLTGCVPHGLASVENSDVDSLNLKVCNGP